MKPQVLKPPLSKMAESRRDKFRMRSEQSAAVTRARAAAWRSEVENDAAASNAADLDIRRKFRMRSEHNGALARARAATRAAAAGAVERASKLSPLRACMSPSKKPLSPTNGLLVEPSSGGGLKGGAALEAAAKLGLEMIPCGARLSVYWAGSDDWFEATVISHHAVKNKSGDVVLLKHKCAA